MMDELPAGQIHNLMQLLQDEAAAMVVSLMSQKPSLGEDIDTRRKCLEIALIRETALLSFAGWKRDWEPHGRTFAEYVDSLVFVIRDEIESVRRGTGRTLKDGLKDA